MALGVLLALLYKRPVSIDRRNFTFFKALRLRQLRVKLIPFCQVSADSFRFNIQECSRSLYAFIAFRPTCFARRYILSWSPLKERLTFAITYNATFEPYRIIWAGELQVNRDFIMTNIQGRQKMNTFFV